MEKREDLIKQDKEKFKNSKWSLYAEIFTELRHRKDEVNMIKDLLKRLCDNKAITTTDINLVNKTMSGNLAFRLQKISTSDRYLKAMSKKLKQKKL
jgi:hypothetical protein|tara:strand:+ start:95 stop:382 length:288 start_codon:yes stop_codon:yes gene_type:complete